jgi:hypothetical protein
MRTNRSLYRFRVTRVDKGDPPLPTAGGWFSARASALAAHFDEWRNRTLHVTLALVVVVAGLVVWHMLRPQLHALEGGIFIESLAIAWLGTSLAHRHTSQMSYEPFTGTLVAMAAQGVRGDR